MLNMKTRELNKNLKFTYLNWIKNEIEDDIENYYSITLHLNPFNSKRSIPFQISN